MWYRLKKLFLATIFLLGIFSVHSQQEAFKITDCELKTAAYPWANELKLQVSGRALAILQGGFVTVSLHYFENRVLWANLSIDQKNKDNDISYEFEQIWDPVNSASQEILFGKYKVTIEFNLTVQNPQIQAKWKQAYGEKPAKLFEKVVNVGNEQDISKQEESLRKMYIEKMKSLNNFFAELQTRKKEALRAPSDSRQKKDNMFVDQGSFSASKWMAWFEQNYINQVTEELKSIHKYRKQVLCPRFEATHTAMAYYCELLVRIGRITTRDLHTHYKLPQNKRNLALIDPNAISSIPDLIRAIQGLHSRSAGELNINLVKELGYLPPPGAN